MTDSPLWMGVDLGTQSVRAVVLDDGGAVIASAYQPLTSSRPGDRHEQDPHQWRIAAATAIRAATAALPANAKVTALAVSGTSGTVVPVDPVSGEPRGVAVMYDDRRGAPHLPAVARVGADVWRRLGYSMQASWALPKILEMSTGVTAAVEVVFAHQPDVITSMLAGRLLPSDLSSALKSGADLDDVTWPAVVFDGLGLSVADMNGLAASGSVIGEVGRAGSEMTGLPVGCAIVAGMTDGCAAQISAGALAPGDWNSVLGTTLVMKGASPSRHVDSTGVLYAHRAPLGDGWYPGGASSTGAGSISALLPGRDLDELTARIDQDAPPVVAYPLTGRGERFPFVCADATGIMPSDAADDDLTFAAILHGVAYLERLAIDLIVATGYDVSGRLLLTGGGARNPVWTQLRADVLQRQVHVPSQSEGAAGMAILAAAGFAADRTPSAADGGSRPGSGSEPGFLASASARMAGPVTVVEPRSDRAPALLDAYSQFVDELDDRGWLSPALLDASRERLIA